jgi:hypothetical protein
MSDNVQFFSFLHLKFAKNDIITQQNFSWKISISIKKTQNFMMISNSLMPNFQDAPNKS